jgi:FkbH-like protein
MNAPAVPAQPRPPAAYLRTQRELRAGGPGGSRALNVVVLSSVAAQLLEPYLFVECAERGFWPTFHFAPFGQIEQAVLSAEELWQTPVDVVLVAAGLEVLSPDLGGAALALEPGGLEAACNALEQRLRGLLAGLRRRSAAKILIANEPAPLRPPAGIADALLRPSQTLMTASANAALARACAGFADTFVLDWAQQAARLGEWRDERMALMARMPLSAPAQIAFAQCFGRHVRALYTPPRKCLVLDLDNTLWGGVVGEDGFDGIQLGEDLPGSAFKAFQRQAMELTRRGILLAVCSKNNPDEALAVLERHPDCLLRPDMFAAMRINWQDKASNIRELADELNLGLDAFAFFDDNPVERAWVRRELPMVAVFEPESSAISYAPLLGSCEWFDQLVVSAEDRARVSLYRTDRQRREVQSSHASLDEFLRDLDMTVTIGRVNESNAQRISQLIAKTNQFNLTTRRRSAAELSAMVAQGGAAWWLRVRDRFGDNGIVGVAAVVPAADSADWRIDLLLMSCRVIGRKVEDTVIALLARHARAAGARRLIGEYVPTARNVMVRNFYRDHGFTPLDDAGGRWLWDFSTQGDPPLSELVRVEHQDQDGLRTT